MTRAVIRLRSTIKANREVKETMTYLRLNQVNHCVLIPRGKSYDGMLQKVKDYVTWGEIKPEVLTNMLLKRGRLLGEKPITNQYIKENAKMDSMVKYAEAIVAGTVKYADLKDVKPVFRLHPPRKGLEGVKNSYKNHGSLGYRGEAINDLILRMLDTPQPGKPVAPAKPELKASAAKPAVKKSAEPAPKKPAAKKAPAKTEAKPEVPKKAEPKAKTEEPKKAPAKKKPKEESK